MVSVHVPLGYCELEFVLDGSIEAEWFRRGEDVALMEFACLGTSLPKRSSRTHVDDVNRRLCIHASRRFR